MQTLEYALTLIDKNLPHTAVEFGVWSGTTLGIIRSALDESYKVFGFDSFEGLPADWEGTPLFKGKFKHDKNLVNIPGTELVVGMFVDTIPEFVSSNPEPVALVHVDCDLYDSAMDVLCGMNDLIVPGTIIVYDEWEFMKAKAEKEAHNDWCQNLNRECELIDFKDDTLRKMYQEQRRIARVLK